jgi:hypothetical protein
MKFNIHSPLFRLLAGYSTIAIALYSSIDFATQGAAGLEAVIIVTACVLFEFVKASSMVDIGFYGSRGESEMMAIKVLIVLTLIAISAVSEGFVLLKPALITNAQTQLNDAHRAKIQTQIDAKMTQLNNCPPNALTKCVNPRTAELSALQAQLNTPVESTSDVQSVVTYMDVLLNKPQYAPLRPLMVRHLVIAVLIEFFGFLSLYEYGRYKRSLDGLATVDADTVERVIQPEPANSMNLSLLSKKQ